MQMESFSSNSSMHSRYLGRGSIQKLDLLGEGSYGRVYKGREMSTGLIVAVKSIKMDLEEEGIPSTALREMSILTNLSHPNIVKMLSSEVFYNNNMEGEAQLIFQFMEMDLQKHIVKNKPPPKQAKHIFRQILKGTLYMHKKGVFHRDLKPHNILVGEGGAVKIADFGLGRIVSVKLHTMSKEIETLFYRSPELILGTQKYDFSVDVWSLGCIFYQVCEHRVLFEGDSEIGMLFSIFRQCGTPRASEWPEILNLPYFRPAYPKFNRNGHNYSKRMSANGRNLLEQMMQINPQKRITVSEALEHKYFSEEEEYDEDDLVLVEINEQK